MDRKIGAAMLRLACDEYAERQAAVVELPARRGFASDDSGAELQGARVQLVLAPAGQGSADLADAVHYERAIIWLFAHQEAARQSELDAITGCIDVLRNDHGSDDELAAFRSADQLRGMVDPSFARVCPQHKAGLPFPGFELECTGDPGHGGGVLLRGAVAPDAGGAGSAQRAELIDEHGGRL